MQEVKTIQLETVKISSLVEATTITENDNTLVNSAGISKKISMKTLRDFITSSVQQEINRIKQNTPSVAIPNIAIFDKNDVKKTYKLQNGNLAFGGSYYAFGVIDRMIPVEQSSKYEILVYQAERIRICEYNNGQYLGEHILNQGYKTSYNYNGSLENEGGTSGYMSGMSFSYFATRSNATHIKIGLEMNDVSTNPNYYPTSSSLMLDNAIDSLKIVKTGAR